MANKSDITELLQEALDKVYEASESLRSAQKLMKEESYSYNITGNMDSYVINYLTGGVDCIADKIEKYIEETNELDSDEDEDDEEEEKFECPDCGCYYWVADRDDFICPNCEDKETEDDVNKLESDSFFNAE